MYRGRYFIRESIYVCGDYIDADIYPVFQSPGKRRKKCKPTSEIQEKLNQKNAERKITRLAHTNFTEKDIALHLTYRDNPESAERAQKDLYNFLRRVKRARAKLGLPELKYLSCTEMGSNGRAHHHLIMSGGMDRDALEELWGKGFSNSKRLQFSENGITDLACYIVKDRQFYKRWNQSRNLIQPEPAVRDGAVTQDDMLDIIDAIENNDAYQYFELRYPEWELIEVKHTKNGLNHGNYVHFEMRKRSKTKKERPAFAFAAAGY